MKKHDKPITQHEALLLMSELCARCEQCEHDLREKMRRKGVGATDIDAVIDYLYEHNFLNEERYARAYVLDKMRFNGWGRIKLRLMLASKRVSAPAVACALEQIDEDEYATVLERVVRQKARGVDLSEYAGRQKLLRSVYSRGFEPQLIAGIIKELIAAQRC